MAAHPVLSSESPATAPDGARPAALPDGSVPRKRGRPRGLPKTGGRQRGTRNQISADLRQEIIEHANPVKFLADVVAGRRIRVGPVAGPGAGKHEYPTVAQRMTAATVLLGKLLPDVKATELSGPDGEPLEVAPLAPVDLAPIDLARRAAFLLRIADPAVQQIEHAAVDALAFALPPEDCATAACEPSPADGDAEQAGAASGQPRAFSDQFGSYPAALK
jgi:hypothetical protein